jgi:hypothetical protein
MSIQGNGMVRTIMVTKHLRVKVKWPEVLLCYNYQNDITDEEEDIIFFIKPELFSIGTINLPNTFQYVKTTKFNHRGIEVKNHNI